MENGDSPASRPARPFAPHRRAHDASSAYGRNALYGPPLGSECDLVTVPARQGLEAVDILRRGAAPAVGPVLHDNSCDTLGFLVPPGTAAAWDLPGSACTQTFGCTQGFGGRGVRAGPAEPVPPVAGAGWLLPPTDTGPVTDPTMLRAALGEAARLIEAADSCR